MIVTITTRNTENNESNDDEDDNEKKMLIYCRIPRKAPIKPWPLTEISNELLRNGKTSTSRLRRLTFNFK